MLGGKYIIFYSMIKDLDFNVVINYCISVYCSNALKSMVLFDELRNGNGLVFEVKSPGFRRYKNLLSQQMANPCIVIHK